MPRRRSSAPPAGPTSFRPLTPDRIDALEALFGENGACGGCWCMYWRQDAKTYATDKGDSNRRAFRALVGRGPAPGVIAFVGDIPAGWCAFAPRPDYVRLRTSRILASVDEAPVWSIPCFFIARPFRGQGLSLPLLEAAVAAARSLGARIIEAYPHDRAPGDRLADAFIYTGIASTFRRAGFREVARRSPTRPIMRLAR